LPISRAAYDCCLYLSRQISSSRPVARAPHRNSPSYRTMPFQQNTPTRILGLAGWLACVCVGVKQRFFDAMLYCTLNNKNCSASFSSQGLMDEDLRPSQPARE
jgi:hypothetical protein